MSQIYNTIKQKVYSLIREDDENSLASSIFDGLIIFLIIINVLLVILDTFSGFPEWVKTSFYYIEVFSVIIFTLEYLMRLWTATYMYSELKPIKAHLKYAFSFMAVIDALAILPFYLPFIFPIDLRVLRTIRLLRLLRIMKVNRYTNALSSVGGVIKSKAPQLISSMLVVLVLMVIASVTMYNIEYEAQPNVFENAFSGLWWSLAAFTTVDNGIYPITTLGMFLSSIIAFLGVGIIAIPTGIISAGFIENTAENKEEVPQEDKHYCPYCGKKID